MRPDDVKPASPFERVLAGTDGSERATEAVRRAGRMGALAGATVDVVFVVDTHHAHDDDVESGADAALRAAGEAARAEGADVRARIVAGDPSASLIDEAVQHDARLIVVGPDGGVLGGTVRVGRVAAHVLRHAPVPVLVGREARGAFPSRVLCGVDGSEGSARTAGLAASVAAAGGAELRLQHVVPVFGGADADVALDANEPSAAIEDAVREARRAGVEPVADVVMGRPENALVETAERDGADLLVVGHRGAGGIARVLLGSVSEHVARHASCSVLVVRAG